MPLLALRTLIVPMLRVSDDEIRINVVPKLLSSAARTFCPQRLFCTRRYQQLPAPPVHEIVAMIVSLSPEKPKVAASNGYLVNFIYHQLRRFPHPSQGGKASRWPMIHPEHEPMASATSALDCHRQPAIYFRLHVFAHGSLIQPAAGRACDATESV